MEAVVVHELPGRTRLRVPAALLSPERAERLADALTAVAGVAKVEINIRTGGVLVSHAPSLLAADLSARAEATLSSLQAEGVPVSPSADGKGITSIARDLKRVFVDADRDLRKATDGMLDLGTATTLTMLAAGAVEIAVTEKLPVPPWFNLAWWSFRTFMTTIEVKAVAAHEVRPAEPPKGVEP
jgi:Heavy metal associated domain 2